MWQVSVTGPAQVEPRAVQVLEETFAVASATYADDKTGQITVSVYPSRLKGAPSRIRAELMEALGAQKGAASQTGGPRVEVQRLPWRNWAHSWKLHFTPLVISPRLLVKPRWSRRRARPGQRVVLLDPGMSFGTGHHPTTLYCLQELDACRLHGGQQSFLDLGAGSGILAIAAAKIGYRPVEALDCDPEAIRVSRKNAARNGVADRVQPRLADLAKMPARPRRRWDVICANLTAGLLASQAGKIASWLQPGGKLVVAGVLGAEFLNICHILETFHLTLIKSVVDKDWKSGTFLLAARKRRATRSSAAG